MWVTRKLRVPLNEKDSDMFNRAIAAIAARKSAMQEKKSKKQFQSISEAARTTGLSARYLREACKAGLIPHVMCGRCFKVDIVALRAASVARGESQH